jgi:hypothetical protein
MNEPTNRRFEQIPPFDNRYPIINDNRISKLESLRAEMLQHLEELKALMIVPSRNNGCAGMWRFEDKEIQS